MTVAYPTTITADVPVVDRDLMLKQAFNTTTSAAATTIILFELDAIGGPIKDIKVEFYLSGDPGIFTPIWSATREGDTTTFVTRLIPALADIGPAAATARFEYVYEDLPEGAQLRFSIAQVGGGGVVPVDAAITYLQAS